MQRQRDYEIKLERQRKTKIHRNVVTENCRDREMKRERERVKLKGREINRQREENIEKWEDGNVETESLRQVAL
jgi:hypothetical protein